MGLINFECKMMMSPIGEIFAGKENEGHRDICERILNKNEILYHEFDGSFETIKELFLIENGFLHFDFVIGDNNKSNLMVLYNSKNQSSITNKIIDNLNNEETKKETIIMIFKKYIPLKEIKKLDNIYILSDDIFEHLSKENQKIVEDEIIRCGVKSGMELMALHLPWNNKKDIGEENNENRKHFK